MKRTLLLSTVSLIASSLLANTTVAATLASEPSVQETNPETDAKYYKQKYNFSEDWFTMRIPQWERVLEPYRGKPNLHYLEVGLYEGRSAIWMIEQILTHPTSKLTGIDIFTTPGLEETWLGNLEISGAKDRATTMAARSQYALRRLPIKGFDIIYIDGSHLARDVMADALLSWELLKPRGTLIFDDYQHRLTTPDEMRPGFAIDAFITAFRNQIEVVHHGYQVFIRKLEKPRLCRYCLAFGQYEYDWGAKLLYLGDREKRFELSEQEVQIVEDLLRGREFGQVGISPSDELKADATFQALAKRLELEY